VDQGFDPEILAGTLRQKGFTAHETKMNYTVKLSGKEYPKDLLTAVKN